MSELNKRYLLAKRALFDRYYGALNKEQREAIYQNSKFTNNSKYES